jgi:hypothetical protein
LKELCDDKPYCNDLLAVVLQKSHPSRRVAAHLRLTLITRRVALHGDTWCQIPYHVSCKNRQPSRPTWPRRGRPQCTGDGLCEISHGSRGATLKRTLCSAPPAEISAMPHVIVMSKNCCRHTVYPSITPRLFVGSSAMGPHGRYDQRWRGELTTREGSTSPPYQKGTPPGAQPPALLQCRASALVGSRWADRWSSLGSRSRVPTPPETLPPQPQRVAH